MEHISSIRVKMSNPNRYVFTEANIKKSIRALQGKIQPKMAPKYFRVFKDRLTVKNSKLFLDEKEVIPKSKIPELARSLLYTKDSETPWSRDGGYAWISERYFGLSRRVWRNALQSQRVKRQSDPLPPQRHKLKGRKVSKKGVIEIDLFHVSKNDMPYSIAKNMKEGDRSDSFVLSMVDRLTGLYYGKFLGNKATKDRKIVMKQVRLGGRWFSERLGVPPGSLFYVQDHGSEFEPISKSFRGLKVNLGPRVEQVNRIAQSNLHRIIKAGRATTIDSGMNQAMKLVNNTPSRIHKGKTPNQLAGTPASQLKDAYNKTRSGGNKIDRHKPFKIGDRVRRVLVNRKAGMQFYKSYKGKQFSQKSYLITKVKKNPNKYFVDGKWRYRDEISWPEPAVDKEADALVESRKKKEQPIGVRLKKKKELAKLLKKLTLAEKLKLKMKMKASG